MMLPCLAYLPICLILLRQILRVPLWGYYGGICHGHTSLSKIVCQRVEADEDGGVQKIFEMVGIFIFTECLP